MLLQLKSRLSSLVAWDNLMTSGHMVTPTPISVTKPPTHEKLFNTHKSRSLSSMAAIRFVIVNTKCSICLSVCYKRVWDFGKVVAKRW